MPPGTAPGEPDAAPSNAEGDTLCRPDEQRRTIGELGGRRSMSARTGPLPRVSRGKTAVGRHARKVDVQGRPAWLAPAQCLARDTLPGPRSLDQGEDGRPIRAAKTP